jgi:lipoprotein NlpD
VKAARAFLSALLLLGGCAAPQRGGAPVEDRRPPSRPAVSTVKPPVATPAATPTPEGTYIVKRGDTLYSIALDHGHDYREIAQWNSLDDPTKLTVGQVLRVKPPAEPAVVLGAATSSNRIESRPLDPPPVEKPAVSAPAPAAPAPSAPPPAGEKPLLEVHPLTFAWPVKGKVVAGFAEPRQKGIDIEGRSGEPVGAAAPGRVTYVGSGIPGLGKLIVIKHDQGYITVYAHNKDILVKEQQSVTRGQKIAELGEKLHFQIRKGAAAVDPLLYLPKS